MPGIQDFYRDFENPGMGYCYITDGFRWRLFMDYEKVRDIVIKFILGDNPVKDEDYRSLNIQIDNFLKELNDKDSPVHVLASDMITDYDLADIIIIHTGRHPSHHLYIDNIKKGKCYSLPILYAGNPDFKEKFDEAIKEVPEIKSRPPIDVLGYRKEIAEIFIDYKSQLKQLANSVDGFSWLLDTIKLQLKEILSNIKYERLWFYEKGVDAFRFRYTNEYIILCAYIISLALIFLVMCNPHVLYKNNTLNCFLEKLNTISDKVDKKLEDKSRDEAYRKSKFESIEYSEQPNRPESIEGFDDTFAELANFYSYSLIYAYFKSLHEMDDLLIKELDGENYKPFDKSIIDDMPEIPKSETAHAIAKKIIKKHRKVDNINEKILNIQSALNANEKVYNYCGDPCDIFQIIIAFQEIYMNKSTYLRKDTQTIIRNLFDGTFDDRISNRPGAKNNTPKVNNTSAYLNFILRRFARGFFTIQGKHDEYKKFIEIERKCQKIFLKSYKTLFDIAQVDLVFDTTCDILNELCSIIKLTSGTNSWVRYIMGDDD